MMKPNVFLTYRNKLNSQFDIIFQIIFSDFVRYKIIRIPVRNHPVDVELFKLK
jgi:hypothetical protein